MEPPFPYQPTASSGGVWPPFTIRMVPNCEGQHLHGAAYMNPRIEGEGAERRIIYRCLYCCGEWSTYLAHLEGQGR